MLDRLRVGEPNASAESLCLCHAALERRGVPKARHVVDEREDEK